VDSDGPEYFRDADYDEVVAFAKGLAYQPSEVAESSTKAEARAARTAQLDRFFVSVDDHAGLPGGLWPEGTRALAEAGFAGGPDALFGHEGDAR